MGTETFNKNGQVSKKPHSSKKNRGKEQYLDRFQKPMFDESPDGFERKWSKDYRKTSLPSRD
jgi:hypothetical protein